MAFHPTDVYVGERLRQLRLQRKMSQSAVAAELNLSFQQIQKYEIGSNRIAASRLYELAKIFKVPISYFFEGLKPTATSEIDQEVARAKGQKEPAETSEITQEIMEQLKSLNDQQQRWLLGHVKTLKHQAA